MHGCNLSSVAPGGLCLRSPELTLRSSGQPPASRRLPLTYDVRCRLQVALCSIAAKPGRRVLHRRAVEVARWHCSLGLPVRWRSAHRRAVGKRFMPALASISHSLAVAGAQSVLRASSFKGASGAMQTARPNMLEQMHGGRGARWATRWRGCKEQTAGPSRASSSPNTSVERTATGGLRPPASAAHLQRWAS
jgi:hypothetical protein